MLRLQSISNQNLLFLAQCLSPVYGDQFLLNPNQNFSQTVMVEKALRLFIFSKRQEKELRLLNSLRSKKRGRRVQLDWTVNQKRRCFENNALLFGRNERKEAEKDIVVDKTGVCLQKCRSRCLCKFLVSCHPHIKSFAPSSLTLSEVRVLAI
jgi:hypothetical protein